MAHDVSLSGKITDETGRPLWGVKVSLFGNMDGPATQEAVTDVHGEYRFDPVKAQLVKGHYYPMLMLQHPTHVSEDGNSHWNLDIPDELGTAVQKDFRFVQGGVVWGVLRHVMGKPIQMELRFALLMDNETDAAKVQATINTGGILRNSYSANTDRKGQFLVTGLPAGHYAIQAMPDGEVLGFVDVAAKQCIGELDLRRPRVKL